MIVIDYEILLSILSIFFTPKFFFKQKNSYFYRSITICFKYICMKCIKLVNLYS